MNINQCFDSKYLSADSDFEDGDLLLTMDSVSMETVGQGQDAKEKPVLWFRETNKGLVLNVTNKNTIVGLYGQETDEWGGKRVKLFTTQTEFQGKPCMAIRVFMKAPQQQRPQPVAAGRAPAEDVPQDDPFSED